MFKCFCYKSYKPSTLPAILYSHHPFTYITLNESNKKSIGRRVKFHTQSIFLTRAQTTDPDLQVAKKQYQEYVCAQLNETCIFFQNYIPSRHPYLQAHGGWDRQSLGRPPTRRAKVPFCPAAGCAATRLARLPSGSGWSCRGWGPLLSLGRRWVQRWDPATQTSSIWSLSSQPARQGRWRKRSLVVQSRCFGIHSAPWGNVLSRV